MIFLSGLCSVLNIFFIITFNSFKVIFFPSAFVIVAIFARSSSILVGIPKVGCAVNTIPKIFFSIFFLNSAKGICLFPSDDKFIISSFNFLSFFFLSISPIYFFSLSALSPNEPTANL